MQSAEDIFNFRSLQYAYVCTFLVFILFQFQVSHVSYFVVVGFILFYFVFETGSYYVA
jgi:Na+/H+ antiporter NhaA